VGFATGDDAGVYALGDGRALVQTVDIFTPVVDSATDWGRIAAANALSDVYAMGATPMTALQYIGWPRGELSFEIAAEVIEAGMDVMASVGCTVVGGHSIDSPEPTFGYAVTGLVDVDRVITNSGARPGDALVLTKPLGSGIATTAIKRGNCPESLERAVGDLMGTVNRTAGEQLHRHGAHAATDITGYGLLGHLREMCLASGTGAEVFYDRVPVLEGIGDMVAEGVWPGGSQRNLESLQPEVKTDRSIAQLKICVDAQTSGGLLVALPEEAAGDYLQAVGQGAVMGRLTSKKGLRLS
jgi:selenide,water dikinase